MASLSDELSDIEFDEFIDALYDGGWFDFVFPFMLVYAVVLTILNKVEIFEDKKAVRVIIALVLALFSIAFPINGDFDSCNVGHYSNGCETLGSLMMTLFPGVSAFAMGVLALYIVVAMMGIDLMEFFSPEDKDNNKWIKYILGAIGLFVVVYYYARGFGWDGFDSGDSGDWLWGDDGLLRDPFLYMVIVFGAVFFWISTDDEEGNKKKDKKKDSKKGDD